MSYKCPAVFQLQVETEPCDFCGVPAVKAVPVTLCDECRAYFRAMEGTYLVIPSRKDIN